MGKYWGTFRQLWLISLILLMATSCMNTDKHIIVAMVENQDDSVLDPTQLWLADKYVMMDNIVIKLVHINSKNDYELILAEKIEISNDGTEIDIKLKKAYFSDGTLITAKDVIASLKRLVILGSAHIPIKDIILQAENLKTIDDDIDGLVFIDDRHLKLKLKARVKEIIYYLTLADTGVVHPSLIRKKEIFQADWNVVSGAYLLKNKRLIKNSYFLVKNEDMPDSIQFKTPPSVGSPKDVLSYDIGYSSFIDKSNNENANLQEPYKYNSGSFNNLTYLVLNTRRPIFSDLKRRQKIQKLISEAFTPDPSYLFFKKANQFFLPDSFAFQKSFVPSKILPENLNDFIIPDFTVLATIGTKKYTTPNLDKDISVALGNKTTISFTDDISMFKTRKIERSFDAYLVPTSMSYNVITESLNLLYRSNVRFGDNPNGRIIKLIKEYQTSSGADPEVIEEIVKEMTLESEIIPLLYTSSPKFYNSDRLDISEMNSAESLTFWKIRVK